MSNFLRRTPCAVLNAGHRTLPPIHQREGRKAGTQRDRGSGRNEDPHPDLGRGVGPVTGSAGSESRSGRGGRHPSASSRGPLGAHTIERPSPKFPIHRRFAGGGAGPWDTAGLPEVSRDEGRLVLIPPGDSHNSDRPPACRWEIGAELEGRSTPRPRLRRRPGDGVGGVRRTVRSRWASPFPPQSRGPLDAHTIKRPSPFVLLSVATVPAPAGPGQVAARRRRTLFTCPTRRVTLARVRSRRPPRRGRRRAPGAGPGRVGARPPGSRPTRSCPGPPRCSSTGSPTSTPCGPCWPAGRPTTPPLEPRAAGRGAGDLRRRGPGRRRRPLGDRRRRCGRPARRHRAGLGVLRLRAGLRLPQRPARRAGRAAARTRRGRGAGRLGRGRRPLVRDLPDRVAGRLAAARPDRPPRSGTPRSDSPALLAPGTRVRLVPA